MNPKARGWAVVEHPAVMLIPGRDRATSVACKVLGYKHINKVKIMLGENAKIGRVNRKAGDVVVVSKFRVYEGRS